MRHAVNINKKNLNTGYLQHRTKKKYHPFFTRTIWS